MKVIWTLFTLAVLCYVTSTFMLLRQNDLEIVFFCDFVRNVHSRQNNYYFGTSKTHIEQ